MQKLQVLKVQFCTSLIEVFETQGINKNNGGNSSNIDEGNDVSNTTIPRLENINYVPQLSNLKQLEIRFCKSLQFVFTFSTLESLKHLEELMIENCEAMKVIVKEDKIEQRKDVGFPRLKFLKLHELPNLEGFYLGMSDFRWPSLEKVMIDFCPKMMVFTLGHSTAPKLEYMHTSLGKYSLECGLNFHVTTNQLPGLDSPNLERLPAWSFHNLIEIDMKSDWRFKCIIPSNELQHLQKLERIRVSGCPNVKEVFDESETVVEIPNLTQVELTNLLNLKYIWTSNDHRRTLLKFPNLTTLSVYRCNSLDHVFTSSMVCSLLQLQDLHISYCHWIDVIVKEEEGFECDANVKEIVLPCLKSLKLDNLKCLKGFCLGRSDFSFPALHTLEIRSCPEITVFTNGRLATPALNIIDTNFGRCDIREDINTFIKNKQDEGFQFKNAFW